MLIVDSRHAEFKECAAKLRAAGIRARAFKRASNPLNFDSGVRPARSPNMTDRLSNSEPARGTGRLWLWCEHADTAEAWRVADAIAEEYRIMFSGSGAPRTAEQLRQSGCKVHAPRNRRA